MTDLAGERGISVTGNTLAGTGAVFRHELRLLLYQPLSYLFQLGFLAVLAASVFLIADFYATDEASIRPLLVFLPWVALILVPALAMRAWIEDHSDRSMELTLTLPVSVGAVVLGKFLAGYLVLIVTLLFTLPLVATVYYLGEPDSGVLFAGYLASALLLGTYYAISLFAAALTREQVGAFVIGIALLFVLLLLGWDVFGRVLRGQVPASIIETLTAYSPNTWLIHISRGVVDFAGVFYFAAVSAASLIGAKLVIGARSRGPLSPARTARGAAVALLIVSLLAGLVPAAQRVPGVLDLTAEKEFTLHDGMFRVLERLPADTQVTLYWSASETSVPATIKSHEIGRASCRERV